MAKKKSDTGKALFDSHDAAPAMPEEHYSGDRPNQNLRTFIEEHATPFDSDTDEYIVAAFDQPITTTKATGIYNLHSYVSKKPHDAIRQYIRHFTKPGELVLDPFSGSGGTSLAALTEDRVAIAIDRSPAATFITMNYCTPLNTGTVRHEFNEVDRKVQAEIAWLYETRCDRCRGKATTGYTVFSQVFQCPRCLQKVPLFDCVEAVGVTNAGKEKKIAVCPYCHRKGHAEEISTRTERFGAIPVLVSYLCQSGCSPVRAERRHNDTDPRKREYFQKYDLAKIEEIESKPIPHWYPRHKMMNVEDGATPWGDKWRAGTSNFRTVADLFTKRNLWALAAVRSAAKTNCHLLFALTGISLNTSLMVRESNTQYVQGTYYIPQISKEVNVWKSFSGRVANLLECADALPGAHSRPRAIVSTQSATQFHAIPSNTIDYIFTDPPYGENVQYGELNFIWEAWLDLDTRWHADEIVINETRGITEAMWADRMRSAMSECFRVLKAGRWLSLCYHDTSEGTWELIQDIMAEVGFVVDRTESALFIDTGQKSFNQYTADKTTKRDLVLNFRKPKPLLFKVGGVYGGEDAGKVPPGDDVATFTDFARQLVRDFLTRHPGSTKDRIYDELVSRLVSSRSMEAHDFDALLKGVADEVQEPVKEDLFRNRDPDLWGSHVQGRWYLKETADQVDHAEQAKEDLAAALLGTFINEYLTKRPELEGVHYSDLFEQYLPVHDKPRRLLADWLVEYFIKTAGGTWRLPDKEEGRQLATLRETGTLRRIKRFANALIEGVPVLDKDRPNSAVDLLDWLRQCRRAGLYEQGKAIFEKGGLNSANLTDEQQIEAEDDYRICARRGSTEEAKPKRQRRRKQDDDE